MPWRLLLTGWLIVLLHGCSSGYAPVTERSMGARSTGKEKPPASYRVQQGDTLYAIAFRYGLDYRQVASWNSIGSRDYIYPGQRLRLQPSSGGRSGTAGTAVREKPLTAVGKPQRPAKPVAKPEVESQSKPGQTASASAPSDSSSGPVQWQWPHSGRILSSFGGGEPANKGVDIIGKQGEPVKAAAAGVVVYSGNGLLGYGNLVILNHNSQYLSAYAHNSRIFVREGDKVKAGEKIAEIGSTGAARTMLHFEIRRDGDPVDPMRYLPKR